MEKQKPIKVEIDLKSVFYVILMLIGLVVAWKLRIVFFIFFVAFIISAAFRPIVDKLEKYKISRFVSIFFLYVIVFAIFGVLIGALIKESSDQMVVLAKQLPTFAYNIINSANDMLPSGFSIGNADQVKTILSEFLNSLIKIDPNTVSKGIDSALGIINTASVTIFVASIILVISVYLLARKDNVLINFAPFINNYKKRNIINLFNRIEERLGVWLRVQILLMISATLISGIGLLIPSLFDPTYPLKGYIFPICTLVFLFEIIPGTGLTVGGIVSAIIALASGNIFYIIYAPLVYIITQQIQSMLMYPKMLNKTVGLDPIVSILAVIAGYSLLSVYGAVLIIPVLVIVQIIIDYRNEELGEQNKD